MNVRLKPIGILASLTLGWVSGALAHAPRPSCEVELRNFRQVILLRDAAIGTHSSGGYEVGRIELEAQRACAKRLGLPLELEQVETTIHRNGRVWGRFYSPSGVFDVRGRELFLAATAGPAPRAPETQSRAMWLDLKHRWLRSPGKRISLGEERQ